MSSEQLNVSSQLQLQMNGILDNLSFSEFSIFSYFNNQFPQLVQHTG